MKKRKNNINIRHNGSARHEPMDVHNTSHDEGKNCYDNDAGNMGCNRFGYLSLSDTHDYRDEKDSEAECNLLDFDGEW